nr:putative sodium-dependent multivitamin transporter [Cherax quadricarinatus]
MDVVPELPCITWEMFVVFLEMSLEEPTAVDHLLKPKLTVVDYTIIALMLVTSLGIGVYGALKSRGNSSSLDYLLGGRTMSPVPITFSLIGGITSAISILGNSSEVYFFGTQISVSVLGMLLGCILVYKVTLPVFFNLRLVSLNEYVEIRFKSSALRKLTSINFMLYMVFYIALVLYAPSLVLSSFTNLASAISVVLMGLICTFYVTIVSKLR